MSRCHLDKLVRVVVAVLLGFDVVAFSDNKHGESRNLQHHVLLVILIEACITLLVERPLIFNMFNDVLVLNTPITVDTELISMSSSLSSILMMPLTLNILINRSFRSQFLIFYWMMMSDQFCSWTMVLLILLIVGMM